MVRLDKYEPLTVFDIWQPKWFGAKGTGHWEAWLKKTKVDHTTTTYLKVVFTKTDAEELKGDWVISKAKARTSRVGNNGRIDVYCVPFEDLQRLEINERDMREVW